MGYKSFPSQATFITLDYKRPLVPLIKTLR